MPTSQDVSTYRATYFAESAPTSAWDMLARVPGFVVVEADADVRGYASARGNVLIDDARPTSKHEDIKSLLERIPSAAVDRVELIRGGVTGIDMAGYAVLANIVRRHEATTDAAVEGGMMAGVDGWHSPLGQLEYARRRDGHALDLAMKFQPELDDDTGRGTIRTTAPDGSLTEQSRLDTRTTKNKGELSSSWRQPLAGGQLTLNAAVRNERDHTSTGITGLTMDNSQQVVREDAITDEAELGARFVRQFSGSTRIEAMATGHRGWLDVSQHSLENGDEEAFDERTRTGESIGRVDLTHAWSDMLSFTGSLEGAFNVLQSQNHLLQDGAAVFLPGSDVRIEERRMEAAIGMTWKPGEHWLLDAGLRLEKSAIEQTGDSPLSRRFTYPKPRVAMQWDVDPRNQLRLSLSREVGQLDFADFVASASLDSDLVSAGNAELEPDKTWRAIAAWEHQLWDSAAFTVSWTHDRISDAVDRVLVVTPDDVFDAPGNIGNGRRDTLALEFSLPLDSLGFDGARLSSSMLWRKSRVTDPVTHRSRPITEEKPVDGNLTLTRDLPAMRLHWSLELDHFAERKNTYRYDEIKRKWQALGWTLSVEHDIDTNWRLRAQVTDLFGRRFVETREKYDGSRADMPLDEMERRDRRSPGYVSLTIRRRL
ncbi:MAG TPA: TonB-dependent receptor [Rhodanobacter sp.]|nr:TonB-dependent receptor [Rhodanobacter sp.]